ncbi:MAG TPA: WD40 repeat domain-containing protein [Candidatus Eremiobacteraeota bacterium]|nr:MAG: hypothetical protein BWY64_03822 [bacterium ADurb.Bin363]HPZ10157.1 WD40 repeat domain-containing protein [Candidatus Eremiobacteraeota bacterium]
MDKYINVIELCQKERYAFIVSGRDEPEFQLWDTENRSCINKQTVEGSGPLTGFKLIDDSVALIECRYKTMKWSSGKGLYDIEKRFYLNESHWEMSGNEQYEPSVKSSDGYRIFARTNENRTLEIRDVMENEAIAFIRHSEPVGLAAFHPYGRLILWGSSDNVLRLWHLEKDRPVTTWQLRGYATACAVTKDELIVCGDSEGYVYFVETPYVPGRVGDADFHNTTLKGKVSDILKTAGEQKKKAESFLKEKYASIKDTVEEKTQKWRKKS